MAMKHYCPETINMPISTHKTYSKVVHIYGSTVKATTPEDDLSTGLHSKVNYVQYVVADRLNINRCML